MDHFTIYQPRVRAGPKERGHRVTQVFAAELLARALPLSEDPDVAGIWQLGEEYREGRASLDELIDVDEENGWAGFTYPELSDLLQVPYRDISGKAWMLEQRLHLAEQALLAAVAVREGYPAWLAEVGLEDVIDQRTLRLAPVPQETAAAFIAEHHSKLPVLNPRGLMYAIGAISGGRLVAVATAGTPTGRWKDPHRVLELTRVASSRSVKGAASMLVARLIDLLPRSVRPGAIGPALFVTYSLSGEEGTTYRALRDKGLRPVAWIPGKGHAGGRRTTAERSLANVDKIRWEAGPGAGTADWSLLERPVASRRTGHRPVELDRTTAVRARLEELLVAHPPPGIEPEYVSAFFARQGDTIEAMLREIAMERASG